MMFKSGTAIKIKQGLGHANNGNHIFSVREFAKICKVSPNTAYKLWYLCDDEADGIVTTNEGNAYRIYARFEEGIKCLSIWQRKMEE
jgi:DNA-binding transcriptional regulator YhcF (GntR family)